MSRERSRVQSCGHILKTAHEAGYKSVAVDHDPATGKVTRVTYSVAPETGEANSETPEDLKKLI